MNGRTRLFTRESEIVRCLKEASGPYDCIVLDGIAGNLSDIQTTFTALRRLSRPETRLIITFGNMVWHTLFSSIARLRGRGKDFPNLLTLRDIRNLLILSGYDVISEQSGTLVPFRIPVVSEFVNRWVRIIPLLKPLCFTNTTVARPVFTNPTDGHYSVSVIIPCRNEAGTIEQAVTHMPHLGTGTEIIFVEDHSTDETRSEMLRVKRKYPHLSISVLIQTRESGKARAVHRGFAAARGDIVMILDGDLSVRPEELRKFYDVLAGGTAEFAMGSRLIYPLEKDSMRFLNILGNKCYSFLFSQILSQPVTDTLCGTKVFFRRDYARMKDIFSGFSGRDPFGDFDLIFSAAKLHLKIMEIPVRYYPRQYGKSNIKRFTNGLQLLRMVAVAMKYL